MISGKSACGLRHLSRSNGRTCGCIMLGMKWTADRSTIFAAFALLLSVAAIQASGQSAPGGQGSAQETQARGVWTDPSTGLMWAGKDNGKDVSWNKAMKYCRALQLSGYSDWRLANIGELAGIYDKDASARGLGVYETEPTTWHVKGNLFLTAYEWSSRPVLDDRGHPTGYAFYIDFDKGNVNYEEKGFSTYKHALCVRGSGK